MANQDPNYRDPKVTTETSSAGTGKWIGTAVAILLGLLLLGWLLGLFSSDTEEATTTGETVVVEEPVATDTETVIVPEGEAVVAPEADAETETVVTEPSDTTVAPEGTDDSDTTTITVPVEPLEETDATTDTN